jgi:hypothetical protein
MANLFLRRLGLSFTCWACTFTLACPTWAQQGNAPAEFKPADVDRQQELETYIQGLSDPTYRNREAAMRHLVDAGTAAIKPLEKAIRSGNLELIDRASSILQDLALLETPGDQGKAWKALERLRQNGPGAASTRAFSSLDLIRGERIKRARSRLDAEGIKAGIQLYPNNGLQEVEDLVRIDDNWSGNLKSLEWFPWLYSTKLALVEGKGVSAEILESLATIPGLRTVRLRDGKLGADGLRKLETLKRIDLLELHFIEIGKGEGDLLALAELPIRQQLIVTGTDFDDEDMEALQGNLKDLQITFSRGGFLGVQCSPAMPTCLVNEVVNGSAAYRAGILPQDVITGLGEHKVQKFEDLQAAVRKFSPGSQTDVTVLRGGRQMTFAIDLGRVD